MFFRVFKLKEHAAMNIVVTTDKKLVNGKWRVKKKRREER